MSTDAAGDEGPRIACSYCCWGGGGGGGGGDLCDRGVEVVHVGEEPVPGPLTTPVHRLQRRLHLQGTNAHQRQASDEAVQKRRWMRDKASAETQPHGTTNHAAVLPVFRDEKCDQQRYVEDS